MDEMNAFEHQLAAELGQMAGPGRRIDGMAMVRTVATQSPRWRFGSMFSATKFVVAGVIVALFGGFLLAGVLTQQSEEALPVGATAGPGTFSPAGSLAEGRFGHTATRLPDGRVLIVGGEYMEDTSVPNGTTAAHAEVWDPAMASFSPAGSLIEARSGHAATLLPDGRVLIAGGFDYDDCDGYCFHYVDRAEVWDPDTASFGPAGSLIGERESHTATLLPDGRVLVVGGGANSPRLKAEVWDPETTSFGPAGTLARSHSNHTATLLPDGRVLIVGGGGNSPVHGAEVWDPETEAFSPAGSFAHTHDGYTVIGGHTATLLPDGDFLVVGGGYVVDRDTADERYEVAASAAVWDPETASLDAAGSLDAGREGHTATLLPDGRVLVVGGSDGHGSGFASAEVWDPATASFSPAGSLAEARSGHTATLLDEGQVFVLGGIGSDGYPASAEVWEPGTSDEPPPVTDSTSDDDTTAPDLLPGVDLVTEEVEPGVYRVVSDGLRDLSAPVVEDIGRYGPSSRIVAAPDGSVWRFGLREFFRLGEARSHEGTRWSVVDVDADGTVWALLEPDRDADDGYGDYRHKDLSTFDGERWERKARKIVDFELHPDGSIWIVDDSQNDSGPMRPVIRRVPDGALLEPDVDNPYVMGPSANGGYGGFAISPVFRPGHECAEYMGWLIDGRGVLELAEASSSNCGGIGGPYGEGRPFALGFGSDGTPWVHSRFDVPILDGGTLEVEPKYFLVRYDALLNENDTPDATYESEVSPVRVEPDLPAAHLDVAPDGSVWLPSDDGLAHFDGETWTWYLRGNIIEDLDIASDGNVWVQANDALLDEDAPPLSDQRATIQTYVITPEAAAVTE